MWQLAAPINVLLYIVLTDTEILSSNDTTVLFMYIKKFILLKDLQSNIFSTFKSHLHTHIQPIDSLLFNFCVCEVLCHFPISYLRSVVIKGDPHTAHACMHKVCGSTVKSLCIGIPSR